MTGVPYEDRAGPLPLVVVPGMLCDASLWRDVDFPEGHDVHHTPLRRADIGALAEDVLATVPGPFVLVGLSLGAIVGFEALRRAPERIAGLCVMATNAGAPRPEQYAAWRAMDELIAAGRFTDVVEETLPDMFPDRCPTPEAARRYRGMAHAVGATAARAQLAAQATRTDATGVLRTARCPTVVLAGARDTLCPPAFHQAIAESVPGAGLTLLPDAGHLLPWQRPEAVTAALREVVTAATHTTPAAAAP
ncbi:Pimeloyl-ACP methyl ester carboxylesterase [Streptomyces melanosporofaciens]|uniref:Pimeloyl-ACP methyl ester carboxylesterase n=2 Tax=Streptomyces melanosporofaciens TaxID=67327 RepID=A0A1H4ZB18_STRMJ|nr:Pimeloyl-ACP methyl ester carboxylesterase [Streptomyces melanosporofaciens]